MQALYEAEDLGALMETVAVSLPDYIRNISSTPHGTVWGEETYAHIPLVMADPVNDTEPNPMTDNETMTV